MAKDSLDNKYNLTIKLKRKCMSVFPSEITRTYISFQNFFLKKRFFRGAHNSRLRFIRIRT